MKFTVDSTILQAALDTVAGVAPKPLTAAGASGYLLVVSDRREEGDATCSIYSRDGLHVARASFPVSEADGEGSFIYPATSIAAFRFFDKQAIVFEAKEEGEVYTVSYATASGAKSEKATVNPALLATCDKDLAESEVVTTFSAGVLREALAMAKPFIGQPQDTKLDEHLKTAQVLDVEKYPTGDGYLYAYNNTLACFVECDAFAGKSLSIHSQHLPVLTAFLGKADGQVEIRKGAQMIYAVDQEGRVLGWSPHHKQHGSFKYYSLEQDNVVMKVPRKLFADALAFIRTELDSKQNKVKFTYLPAGADGRPELRVQVADEKSKVQSFPIPVEVIKDTGKEWTFSMNLDHLSLLLSGYKSHQVELRAGFLKHGSKLLALFRTRDTFKTDADGKVATEGVHTWTVTRLSPSKE